MESIASGSSKRKERVGSESLAVEAVSHSRSTSSVTPPAAGGGAEAASAPPARLRETTPMSRSYCALEQVHTSSLPLPEMSVARPALAPTPRSTDSRSDTSSIICDSPPVASSAPSPSGSSADSCMRSIAMTMQSSSSAPPPPGPAAVRRSSELCTAMLPRSPRNPSDESGSKGRRTSGLPTSMSSAIADASSAPSASTDRATCTTVLAVALISAPSTPSCR
mmetsp:Transcript_26298/g.83553  ORF Transcript_26298/g.83553 Transcript_26298/m.83553 type:complete len:222 (+) Transcript_26298:224-889(+)